MSEQRPLALTFPLHGSRLIEASAGTGKTFTISALYLRLILGHGGEAAFRELLLPPQILVVTFTDAATRELRDRIRARLVEAAAVFRGDAQGDDLLRELRSDFAQTQWDECARRLELAAQWMDEAAVSTIHGWCQRMLREHAFDSGSLFSQTLETDHSELLAEVVRDYWRQNCYPLQGPALQWVASVWGTPDGLGARLRPLLGEESEGATQSLSELLDHALQQRDQALVELKSPWLAWAEELQLLLDAAVAAKQVDGKKIQAREVKLAMLAVLIVPFCILGFSAVAAVLPAALGAVQDRGPHGLSEILYAYSSAAGNNGSAFAGFGADTPYLNTTLGIAMLLGRYAVIVPVLAIAGSVAAKPKLPPSSGSFPTHGPLFVGLLCGVILILGGLQFLPALFLGPVAEHFALMAGQTF